MKKRYSNFSYSKVTYVDLDCHLVFHLVTTLGLELLMVDLDCHLVFGAVGDHARTRTSKGGFGLSPGFWSCSKVKVPKVLTSPKVLEYFSLFLLLLKCSLLLNSLFLL